MQSNGRNRATCDAHPSVDPGRIAPIPDLAALAFEWEFRREALSWRECPRALFENFTWRTPKCSTSRKGGVDFHSSYKDLFTFVSFCGGRL